MSIRISYIKSKSGSSLSSFSFTQNTHHSNSILYTFFVLSWMEFVFCTNGGRERTINEREKGTERMSERKKRLLGPKCHFSLFQWCLQDKTNCVQTEREREREGERERMTGDAFEWYSKARPVVAMAIGHDDHLGQRPLVFSLSLSLSCALERWKCIHLPRGSFKQKDLHHRGRERKFHSCHR